MTQRAFIIGSISFIIYVTVLFNGLPQFLILTWLLVSIMVSSAGVALLSLQGLRCDWRVTRALATESGGLREGGEALVPRGAPQTDGALSGTLGGTAEFGTVARNRAQTVASPSMAAFNGAGLDDEDALSTAAQAVVAGPATGTTAAGTFTDGPTIEVQLANFGTLHKAGVLLDVRLRHMGSDRRVTRRFLVEALPARASITAVLTLSGLPRGRYHIDELRFTGSDVLGLFRATLRVSGHSSHPERNGERPQAARRRVKSAFAALAGPLRLLSGTLLGAVAGGVIGGVTGYAIGEMVVSGGSGVYSDSGSSAGSTVGLLFGILFGALVGGDQAKAQMRRLAGRQDRERDRRKDGEGTFRQVLVGPATVKASGPITTRTSAAGGDIAASKLPGRGDEMRGTRPYVAGDDLRTVHWKSTARLGRLVVKEFHPPGRAQGAVVWDGAAWEGALRNGAAPHDAAASEDADEPSPAHAAFAQATEDGLRLAASLCRELTEQGRPCTLLRLDRASMCVTPGTGAPGAHGLPVPAPDAAAFGARCAETLADARADRDTPLARALGPHLHHLGQGGAAYLVTASLSPDVADAVRSLQQRGLSVAVGLVVVPQPESVARRRAKHGAKHGAKHSARHDARRTNGVRAPATEKNPGGYAPHQSHHQQAEALSQTGARVVLLMPRASGAQGAPPAASPFTASPDEQSSRGASPAPSISLTPPASFTADALEGVRAALGELLDAPDGGFAAARGRNYRAASSLRATFPDAPIARRERQ